MFLDEEDVDEVGFTGLTKTIRIDDSSSSHENDLFAVGEDDDGGDVSSAIVMSSLIRENSEFLESGRHRQRKRTAKGVFL